MQRRGGWDDAESEIQPAPSRLGPAESATSVMRQDSGAAGSVRMARRGASQDIGPERSSARPIATQRVQHPALARLSAQPHAVTPSGSRGGDSPVVRNLEPGLSASAPTAHQGNLRDAV